MAELEQERAKLASSASSSADYKNMYDNLVKQLELLNSDIEGISLECPQTGGKRRSNKKKNRKSRNNRRSRNNRKTKKPRKSRNNRLRKRSRRR